MRQTGHEHVMSFAIAAELQVVLEGAPLPARRDELVAYAQAQGADERLLQALRGVPDREYRSLDDVGEQVAPVQPQPGPKDSKPHEESGAPPGGADYTRIPTDTGQVRE
jgi:hypothetical protein